MAKKTHLLEVVQIRNWLRAGEPVAKSDGDGLTFTLSVGGTATWVLRFRHGGRRHELTLGRYNDMSLAEARKTASTKRLEVQNGVNPATERRKAAARKDWNVRKLAEDYRRLVLPSLAVGTQKGYERNLKRIETAIGTLVIRDVEAADIVGVLDRNSKLGWVEAHTLLVVLKMLFTHAAGKKLVNANPCHGVELSALRGSRPEVRKRLMLSEAEIHTILNAQMNRENGLALRVLLATGVRVAELYTAKWEHIDLDRANWHLPKSKTGTGMDIPLVPAVIEWFRELRVLAGDSGYVLPARSLARAAAGGGDSHISKGTLGEAIDYWIDMHKPGVRRFTPHDLRSTMKSHMRALGVSRDVSEMCLNHKLKGVEGVYDVHTYYPERRAALELWAGYLVNCQTGKPWNVTPFKRTA
ncbi:integrase arm-type DNA-binding domain-containing protein [Cupriavidus sp. CV2]|uniref:tyrosine-type recombinase/integrase n=1 Tax=Cupriavidus ulmosensis TaxID=3065913 RepID=UPI00296AE843|nr:integrase arm-type DNA-binding domain-containing protein [Cupriavidus sp. CV2]MDW3684002.1 integrase arm-type DNA-binding domain-containing protein [Cupriavidus sp. CV2]